MIFRYQNHAVIEISLYEHSIDTAHMLWRGTIQIAMKGADCYVTHAQTELAQWISAARFLASPTATTTQSTLEA